MTSRVEPRPPTGQIRGGGVASLYTLEHAISSGKRSLSQSGLIRFE